MRLKLYASFSRKFFLGRLWGSPRFYSGLPSWPSITLDDTLPKESSDEKPPVVRIPWEFRDSKTWAAPSPRTYPEPRMPSNLPEQVKPQAPPPEPPDLPGGVPSHTICIHNVPYETLIGDVLDIVQFGTIFHIQDSIRNGSRVVALTFSEADAALGFYRDVTNHEVNLYGRRLEFTWGQGPKPFLDPNRSRAFTICDRGQLGTEQELTDYLQAFGPIDKLSIMREKGQDRAFINFLSVDSGVHAAQTFRDAGARVVPVPDRCWVAGKAKALALENNSRTIMLRNIPPGASLSDVCDQIRGGGIYRMGVVPESGLAYIHFIEHSSAVSFHRYALYNGVMVKNRRLSAVFLAQSKQIPRFLRDEIDRGVTRCLAIEGILNADMLRNDCLRYGNVERITFSETKSIVSFSAVQHALKTSRLLPTKLAYQGLKITFADDPCAAPYETDLEKAAALQAEISALLIPSNTQQQQYNAVIPTNRIKM